MPVRLNFLVAFFQFDPVPTPAVVMADNGGLAVVIPDNGGSALGGVETSNGAPSVGVSNSDEVEELVASIWPCREFGRGLERWLTSPLE